MKNIVSKLFLTSILFLLAGIVSAKDYEKGAKTQKKSVSSPNKADSDRCRRASSSMQLSINNVRTVINGNGNMWMGQGRAYYFVPANGNSTALFCGALWVGGKDENDQLRVAAVRFGSDGDDFWPGPLSADGMASTNQSSCSKWDQHFRITKSEVQAFVADPSTVTDVIKNWPAHGTEPTQSRYIAPFFDKDGDGIYNYAAGDYPYYDFDNELCPKVLKANLPPGGRYTPAKTMEDSINRTQAGSPLKPEVSGGLLVDQVLKGDQTVFWVFNDNGNAHTESHSDNAIGLEIRAQAFAFTTNDEINNMTFYSYEIVNRSSYTINKTYFSQWVDADLGYAFDDYVGCDVKRGLGYCYNGKAIDGPGDGAYSGNPPAVGIDFFQGPYMDPDGKDNPKIDIAKMKMYYATQLSKYALKDALGKIMLADTINKKDTIYDTIQLTEDAELYYDNENGGAWYFTPGDYVGNCAINGVNFGNGIPDDERFGMRRFVYHNIGNDIRNGDPAKAQDYYNYLSGIWKDGRRMTFGGTGYGGSLDCDFMFPAKTDPWNWGTNGVDPNFTNTKGWTEETANNGGPNSIGDRRFMQSAGPFTLKPGAVNYITVGIPWAKATSGGPYASVELLRQVDDKCQALFDNCFKLLEGPDAPTLIVQEMSNQVILYLSYQNQSSNNYSEKYREVDQRIPKTYITNELESQDTVIGINTATGTTDTVYVNQKYKEKSYTQDQRSYIFEGYQIYQLKDATVSVADIYDLNKSRLVVQCDIENYYDSAKTQPIGKLINYEKDNNIGALVPVEKVSGLNKGIQHSFVVKTDLFATTTNTQLINNKKYYFIAVAYAQNRYKAYDPTNPDALDGQKEPYLAGRKNETQGSIVSVEAIPHDPSIENGGTIVQASYGTSPEITRIAGHGNGGMILELTEKSKNEILSLPFDDFSKSQYIPTPVYRKNAGPVNIKVVDPLNVKEGQYYISFTGITDTSRWYLTRTDGKSIPVAERDNTGKVERDPSTNAIIYRYVDTIMADTTLGTPYEQLFLDLGISISIAKINDVATQGNLLFVNSERRFYNGGGVIPGALLQSNITFADPTKVWLTGRADYDSRTPYNWIRSGGTFESDAQHSAYGSVSGPSQEDSLAHVNQDYYYQNSSSSGFTPISLDEKGEMEGIVTADRGDGVLSGWWAPYKLVSNTSTHPAFSAYYHAPSGASGATIRALSDWQKDMGLIFNNMNNLASVDIVFTSDKSKWSRCPVIEMCDDPSNSEGNAKRFQLRRHNSVDKEGNNDGTGTGMGWFPGYVINVETGERLNIFFGEDSWLSQHNGRDMLWNPVPGSQNALGGKHYLYILGNNTITFKTTTRTEKSVPYDKGAWAYEKLKTLDNLSWSNQTPTDPALDPVSILFANVMWVGMPLVSDQKYAVEKGQQIKIPTETTIRIRVRKPYVMNYTNNDIVGQDPVQNANNPKYMFGISSDMVTLTNQAQNNQSIANQLLDKITVVPNPYYARTEYELAQLDNRVRITNLPAKSRVTIYTPDGTLIRRYDSPDERYETYQLDWDLKNQTGIPIAGGVYLIHVSVPGMGERVIKWFGALRTIDLNSYQF